MEFQIYLWTAIVGCTLLVAQIVLQLIGLGGEADVDAGSADVDAHVDFDTDGHVDGDGHDPAHGTAGNVFFGVLSFKALVSFAGIFGLTGLSLYETDLALMNRLLFSFLAGVVAMVIVAYMMRALHHLSSSGTVVLSNALGCQASVYLRIPGGGKGQGKVTIELQDRHFELAAVTDGPEIATGSIVKVVEVLANETLKVSRV